MEYLVIGLVLLAGVGVGIGIGVMWTLGQVSRVARSAPDRDTDHELAPDPHLEAIVRSIITSSRGAFHGEYPAAAGQPPCVASGPNGSQCDRPAGHDGPHAEHRDLDLVHPVVLWSSN